MNWSGAVLNRCTLKATLSAMVISCAAMAFSATALSVEEAAHHETHTEDIQSTLSQHAASTTTITETFKYDLKHPGSVPFLYNGCRGSRMGPCGCRALNLGGIDREAAMVETFRAARPDTIYVDAGGIFREFTDPSMRLQTWHMMGALEKLNCQAINIGFPDLRQGMAALQFFQKKFNLPFISANIVDANSGKSVFPAYKTFDGTTADGKRIKIAVVGVTAKNRDASRGTTGLMDAAADPVDSPGFGLYGSPNRGRWMIAETNGQIPWMPMNSHVVTQNAFEQGGAAPTPASGGELPPAVRFAVQGASGVTTASIAPYRLDDPWATAQKLGRELRPKYDYVVLLAYASQPVAINMADKLMDYDLVIAADYLRRVEPVQISNGGPLITGGDRDGKYLGIVEIYGKDVEKKGDLSAEADLLPILQSIKPDPKYAVFLEQFAEDTKKLPVQEPPSQLSEKIYAGVTSCRACHIDAYKQWKTHKHSHAMKTLVDKKMHYNPDCLRCHTVAYRQPGGFTDIRVTANLSNVQCEVCHGPGEQHVKNMRAAEALKRQGKPVPPPTTKADMRMTWDANFCMKCHNPQNDPRFNFEQDIQRVRHKNPMPQRVRPTTASLEM